MRRYQFILAPNAAARHKRAVNRYDAQFALLPLVLAIAVVAALTTSWAVRERVAGTVLTAAIVAAIATWLISYTIAARKMYNLCKSGLAVKAVPFGVARDGYSYIVAMVALVPSYDARQELYAALWTLVRQTADREWNLKVASATATEDLWIVFHEFMHNRVAPNLRRR